MVVVCRAREARRARKALIARTAVVAADIADAVSAPVTLRCIAARIRVWLWRSNACGFLLLGPLLHPPPAVIRVRFTHLLGPPDTG